MVDSLAANKRLCITSSEIVERQNRGILSLLLPLELVLTRGDYFFGYC